MQRRCSLVGLTEKGKAKGRKEQKNTKGVGWVGGGVGERACRYEEAKHFHAFAFI